MEAICWVDGKIPFSSFFTHQTNIQSFTKKVMKECEEKKQDFFST